MDKDPRITILQILSQQTDMTLATLRDDGYPQATTVSYVSDALDIYFATSPKSQKVRNIARSDKISLTVTPPYSDWNSIRGLSIGGRAERLTGPSAILRAEALFFQKFPYVVQYAPDDRRNLAYFRIIPEFVTVLDYTLGFGHTEHLTMKLAEPLA